MSLDKIRLLTQNKLLISEKELFCAIIGSNPSKGARSPILWNSVYKNIGKPIKMIAIDCTKKDIYNLLKHLDSNHYFIGGAIAAPYKEDVAIWLKNKLSIESKKIGAVNCIYRNEKNQLYGTNTDGEASVLSIKKKFGSLKNKNVILLGSGGTAKSVTAYLSKEITPLGNIYVVGRNFKKLKFHEKYKNVKAFLWKDLESLLNKSDIIINCTSIGWGEQDKDSPISESLFNILKKNIKIFDVIYDPSLTILLSYAEKYNLDYLNGLEMNLEQAVIAYSKVNKIKNNLNKIRKFMKLAVK